MAEKEVYRGLTPEERDLKGVPILGGLQAFYSNLLPIERDVITAPETTYTYDDMGARYPSTTPGVYGEARLGTPAAIQGGIDFFQQLLEDPSGTAEAVASGILSIPEQQYVAGMGMVEGYDSVYDPTTGEEYTYDPLMVPAGMAIGTARSLSQASKLGDSGPAIGMFGGKDSKFGSRMQEMLREAKQIRSNTNQEEAFHNTSFLQRGYPEIQMTALQRYMGGGVNSYVIEHGGDLLHRMTENGGNFSELAKPKVKSLLRVLESPYGFERELAENMRANHLYDLKTSKEDGTPSKAGTLEEFEQNIHKGLSEYASPEPFAPFVEKQYVRQRF